MLASVSPTPIAPNPQMSSVLQKKNLCFVKTDQKELTKMPRFMSNKQMNKQLMMSAAKTIQRVWRGYKVRKCRKIQKRLEDNYFTNYADDDYDNYEYIPCRMCGANCWGDDWERWRFCSRRCMVYSSRGSRW
jgi:hypothetical protein